MGQRVRYPVGAGTGSGYLAPPGLGAGPALIVIGEGVALDRHLEDVCDRCSAEGFTALAPDLESPGALGGAIDFLEGSDTVRGQGVGVVGFGPGAVLALDLAVQRPDDVRACVAFYGLATALDWSRLRAPVQGHFAEEDVADPADEVRRLEQTLDGLGREVQLFYYAAAPGFFDDSRRETFEPESARTAWIRTLDFLRSKLG